MTKEKKKAQEKKAQDNEGEGNRTAARRYNEGVARTLRTGQVAEKAKEAAAALDGPEGEELRRAEEEGKSRAADLEANAGPGEKKPGADPEDERAEDWLRKVS